MIPQAPYYHIAMLSSAFLHLIQKIGTHSVHVGSLHHAIYQATKLGSLFC